MNKLVELEIWLCNSFAWMRNLKGLYMIGSILFKEFSDVNDVDIIQVIDFNDNIQIYTLEIARIQDSFFKEYDKKLHITTFSQKELVDFEVFMSSNSFVKVL